MKRSSPDASSTPSSPCPSRTRDELRTILETKLGGEHLAQRAGAGGMKVTYVESWKAIELANAVFGFDGWSTRIVDISPDFIYETKDGKHHVGVTAILRVTLKDGTSHEDVGVGTGDDKNKGLAIEKAKKEAVSDARKRALRVFGHALGNCVYDRTHLQQIKAKVKATASASVTYASLDQGPSALNEALASPSTNTAMSIPISSSSPGPSNRVEAAPQALVAPPQPPVTSTADDLEFFDNDELDALLGQL